MPPPLLVRGHARGGVLLLLGAGLYAVLVGALDVTFNATPLILGLVALGAGVLGSSPGLVPPGLALVGWGAAVLLVREGPIADVREAPAFLVGAGLGILAAMVVARAGRATAPSLGAALAAVLGGLALFVAYDVPAFGEWPLWAAAAAAAGLVEIGRGRAAPAGGRPRTHR